MSAASRPVAEPLVAAGTAAAGSFPARRIHRPAGVPAGLPAAAPSTAASFAGILRADFWIPSTQPAAVAVAEAGTRKATAGPTALPRFESKEESESMKVKTLPNPQYS